MSIPNYAELTDEQIDARLIRATKIKVLEIMENGRQCYDPLGNPIPDKFTQPSAADFQASLKLQHRNDVKNPKGTGNPWAEADESIKTAIGQACHPLPPIDTYDDGEWKPEA